MKVLYHFCTTSQFWLILLRIYALAQLLYSEDSASAECADSLQMDMETAALMLYFSALLWPSLDLAWWPPAWNWSLKLFAKQTKIFSPSLSCKDAPTEICCMYICLIFLQITKWDEMEAVCGFVMWCIILHRLF